MNIWGVTDKGVVRQQNQDDFHIELTQPDVALGIVCDGMGGATNSISSGTPGLFRCCRVLTDPPAGKYRRIFR